MTHTEPGGESGRLHAPCDVLTSKFKGPEQLVVTCRNCDRFYSRCCLHLKTTCHYGQVVYTDGACSNNGKSGAVAGIGIAFGTRNGNPGDEDTHQFSIAVDDRLDPGARRTNQRAELLAALEGLKRICDANGEEMAYDSAIRKEHQDYLSEPPLAVIITTDSEYVVKGMTEWLPNWQKNGLRKSNGQRPLNLDLFLKLDAEVKEREQRHDCKVKFWHISRIYNTIADQLAKDGARAAAIDVNEALGECLGGMIALVL